MTQEIPRITKSHSGDKEILRNY